MILPNVPALKLVAGSADLELGDAPGQEIRKGMPGRAAVNLPGAAGAGDPAPVQDLGALKPLCPPDRLVDIAAVRPPRLAIRLLVFPPVVGFHLAPVR